MYPTKRRRLNDASALHKPFRSPLRTAVESDTHKKYLEKGDDVTKESILPVEQASLNSPCNAEATTDVNQSRSAQTSPAAPRQSNVSIAQPAQIQPTSHSSARSALRQTHHSREHIALQKRYSALTLEHKKLDAAVDTSTRALQILRHPKHDAELRALIQRWRAIAQDAAEEVFVHAKERVNFIGGVSALRAKPTRHDDERDGMGKEQLEELAATRKSTQQTSDRYEDFGSHEEDFDDHTDPGNDADSLTMRVMLEQMNIDLEVIGYDKCTEEWIERPG